MVRAHCHVVHLRVRCLSQPPLLLAIAEYLTRYWLTPFPVPKAYGLNGNGNGSNGSSTVDSSKPMSPSSPQAAAGLGQDPVGTYAGTSSGGNGNGTMRLWTFNQLEQRVHKRMHVPCRFTASPPPPPGSPRPVYTDFHSPSLFTVSGHCSHSQKGSN